MALLELSAVRKTYGEGENAFEALKGIDLVINEGQFVSIMGPSGSGKSTLMNILGALDKPSSGDYKLRGTSVASLKDRDLAEFRNQQVGFIFQQFNLLDRTSVFDNVALPGLYGNLSGLSERVLEVLEQVGLADKLKNHSTELSGGQIQRVAIARALLMRPAILMADEPTGNLDSKTAAGIMELITELHDAGNTVILITHEPEIAKYAERHITLRDGEIISDQSSAKSANKKGEKPIKKNLKSAEKAE